MLEILGRTESARREGEEQLILDRKKTAVYS